MVPVRDGGPTTAPGFQTGPIVGGGCLPIEGRALVRDPVLYALDRTLPHPGMSGVQPGQLPGVPVPAVPRGAGQTRARAPLLARPDEGQTSRTPHHRPGSG